MSDNSRTTTIYRIKSCGYHNALYQAQIKKWWGWKNVGIGRASEERAMNELKKALGRPKLVSEQDIINARTIEL